MRTKSRVGLIFSALLAATFVATGIPAAAAAADGVGVAASCARTYNAKTESRSSTGSFWYDTPRHHIVDCGTISIRSLEASSVCASFRVRIFPSSGGDYTRPQPGEGWPPTLCGGQAMNLATGFLVGTEYRLESTRQNMDVRVRD